MIGEAIKMSKCGVKSIDLDENIAKRIEKSPP